MFDSFTNFVHSVTSFPVGANFGTLKYPSNVGEGVFPSCIQFSEYKRTSPTTSQPWTTIVMYMPEKISNPSTVSWEGDKTLSAAAINAISNGDYMGAVGSFGKSSAVQIFKNSLGSYADASLAGLHVAENPYITMMFKGVDQREFSFSFKLFPHSFEECHNIHDIVTAFRSAAYPTGDAGDTTLGYPSEFEIKYLFNGTPSPWLNKFKRSVITKVDVDYTGSGGWTVTRDGFPSEISIDLQFKEMQIITSNDIQTGY